MDERKGGERPIKTVSVGVGDLDFSKGRIFSQRGVSNNVERAWREVGTWGRHSLLFRVNGKMARNAKRTSQSERRAHSCLVGKR